MLQTKFYSVFLIISIVQFSWAGVIRPPSPIISDEAKEEFERQVRLETEEFLNNIFKNQIGFFNKVKTSLDPATQRYKDIETYVGKLEVAKEEKSLDKKDELYFDSLRKIDKSTLFLNERQETGLEDDDYQKILEENGLKDLMKNFLADVAVYFWKMAKHSGKVVESTMDRFIENMQKDKVVF
ncbi:hypothetical protein FF38_00031 [Lucilia cuprina]|uniref:Uncharacterized protein n=1 Tax=Lucilia cuprina TaxID=7375 RepID=A0A0L0BMC7_LUCCU|nr:uncharacterized protein LOC111689231 [Lucilia cuprina]KNC21172.1 hypothetical protein FF38_00031 [Lucilia cuprina]